MNSPFPYDRLPTKEEFFGRTEELTKLSRFTDHSNNLLVHSKRRMGKSALIRTFFAQISSPALCIYADIFDIASKEDFARTLLKALSNAQKGDLKSNIKKLASLFKRVRLEPSIDANTLEYSIKPIVTTLSFEQMMEDFFGTLSELSKSQKIILAIDEFQQIDTLTDIKLDAFLRPHIQNRVNISYIFLGSKRHLLTSLFEYKSPLYELATHFELGALKIDDIYAYAKKHIDITYEQCEYIYTRSDGETRMIQNILHLLYLDKTTRIDDAIEETIASKDASYRMLFDTLANNQKIALKIVGKNKSGFFAQEVLNDYNIKKQTLQSALDTLFKKELIDKDGEGYFIPDRTLELWVARL